MDKTTTLRRSPVAAASSTDSQKQASLVGPGTGQGVRRWLRARPVLYGVVSKLLSPVLVTGPNPADVLAESLARGLTLDLGSANQRRAARFTNVDCVPYPEVDVVADLQQLPFSDETVTGVCSIVCLEHVADPGRALDEMHRVLERGGQLFIAVPFLQPFHDSPSDYWRWTDRGLSAELTRRGFHVSSVGVYCGPASAFAWALAAFLTQVVSMGFRPLRDWLELPLQALFSPIKWLDVVLARCPGAVRVSATIFAIATKK